MSKDLAVCLKEYLFQSLHGKSVYHTILKKEIPIVCDKDLVDMEFGTGVVKVQIQKKKKIEGIADLLEKYIDYTCS